MADAVQTKKKTDLPPFGPSNPDPLTGASGAHPIEAGIGTALGGAAAGLALGAVGGPIGAVAGAVIGGIAGGFAGKGVGEYIDPTTEDNHLRDRFKTREYAKDGDSYETYQPVYRYGAQAEANNVGKTFDEIETDVQSGYSNQPVPPPLPWDRARGAVSDGYSRAAELRKQRGCATK